MAHNQVDYLAQRKHFAAYWSMEAVNVALQKGDVFKAMFRVNAHNRVEAYCKIDGLPVDVLISGFYSQNRAVEGDIVAIKVDPFSSWTKMKGSVVVANTDNTNGQPSPEKLLHNNINDTFHGQELIRPANFDLDHTTASSPSEVVRLVEKLSSLITSFPSKRPTGRVVAIIETSPRRNTIVGFLRIKNWLFNKTKLPIPSSSPKHEHIQLIPNDPKFPKMMVRVKTLPNTITKRLHDCDLTLETDLIAAQIFEWSEEYDSPCAHVLHVFGRGGEVESQISAILFQNSINSSDFTPEAISCIPHLSWRIPEEEFKRRRDLRNLCTFTIDPATASDLDDALSIEKLPNGVYRVGVHIADVSYFVHPHTPLDLEAQIRSTSVYLQKQKLPMLPPLLSDNLSSLTPNVERLAFSIIWDINPNGMVLDRWIGRTIVKSCCKLSYEQAQGILDDVSVSNLGSCSFSPSVITSVHNLYEISKVLKEKRFKGGALSLESPKLVFLFDKDGTPYDCVLSGRSKSNFLVEEFMLLANTTAAEVITRAYPFTALLRKHPEPNLSKLKDLESFCYKHGLHLNSSTSGQLHQSLETLRHELKGDSVLFDVLMSYATRPMQLASYFCSGDLNLIDGGQYLGHYALAVPLYTHFTSPLRRYPDIIVHRTLAATLEAEEILKKNGGKLFERYFTKLLFEKVETFDVQKALLDAAVRYVVPGTESLADVAAHCNERKLASRYVKDATDRLYMWLLLRNKEVFLSEARVLGLGPRFMSIYVTKLAMERRIYYDEVDGLTAEWLDATSTLILNYYPNNRSHNKKGSSNKFKSIEEVAMVTFPYDTESEVVDGFGDMGISDSVTVPESNSDSDIKAVFFPLVLRILSTIPVALHPIGGDDGPIDIGARLYMSSYFS